MAGRFAKEVEAAKAVWYAANVTDVEKLAAALDAGGDPNSAPADDGDTPLHAAISCAIEAIGEARVAAKAEKDGDVEAKEATDVDAVFKSADARAAECVGLLIRKGKVNPEIGDSFGATPLMRAAANGLEQVLRVLLAAGVDMNKQHKEVDEGSTALHQAVFTGQAGTVQVLVDAGASLECTDSEGATPLDVAKAEHDMEIARILITAAVARKKA